MKEDSDDGNNDKDFHFVIESNMTDDKLGTEVHKKVKARCERREKETSERE